MNNGRTTKYYVPPDMMKDEIYSIWKERTINFPLQKYGILLTELQESFTIFFV
jgi:hypothetical protein